MSWTRRLRRRLLDDTGSTLLDAMVGVIIISIASTAIVGVVQGTQIASTTASIDGARQAYLRSAISTLAANPATVPTTPTTSTVQIDNYTVNVTQYRHVETDGTTTIRLVADRASDYACTGTRVSSPSAEDYRRCLFDETVLPAATTTTDPTWAAATLSSPVSGVGSTGATVNAVAAPVVVATAPANAAQNFVLDITAISQSGTFTATQGSTVLSTISLARGDDEWVYGSLSAADPAGAPISFTWAGASATLSHLTAYKVTS